MCQEKLRVPPMLSLEGVYACRPTHIVISHAMTTPPGHFVVRGRYVGRGERRYYKKANMLLVIHE